MIFTNNKAYIVEKNTTNKTNTKSFDSLSNDFIFETTFRLTKKQIKKEMCIISRQGYNMGFFIQEFEKKYFLKWVWWEVNENNEHIYNDIFYKEEIIMNDVYNVKIIKKNNKFVLYINDLEKETKLIKENLYDYNEKNIFIGAANPDCEHGDYGWFNGEILDVKIYESSDEIIDDLFLWYDFKKETTFKVFDRSGNGNHGLKHESKDKKKEKIEEFNKVARPAKIINV